MGWSLEENASLGHGGSKQGGARVLRAWNVQEGIYLYMKPPGLSQPFDLASVWEQ